MGVGREGSLDLWRFVLVRRKIHDLSAGQREREGQGTRDGDVACSICLSARRDLSRDGGDVLAPEAEHPNPPLEYRVYTSIPGFLEQTLRPLQLHFALGIE